MSLVRNLAHALARIQGLRNLSRDDAAQAILDAVHHAVDENRAVPQDPNDVLDRTGAAAVARMALRIFGDEPRDDLADLEARQGVLSYLFDGMLSEAIPDRPKGDRLAGEVSLRVVNIIGTLGAWTRDGMPTYDVTKGLYKLLRRSVTDPSVGLLNATDAAFSRSAFAVRLPGPDYPVIEDAGGSEAEVRGAVVWRFHDTPTLDAANAVREAIRGAAENDAALRVAGADDPLNPRTSEITRAMSLAGRSALTETVPAVSIVLCCFDRQKRRALAHFENPHLMLRVGWQRGEKPVTLREAVESGTKAMAAALGSVTAAEPFLDALNVALGAGLYIDNVEPGHPIHASPVRRLDGKPIKPKAWVLGRGVSALTKGEVTP